MPRKPPILGLATGAVVLNSVRRLRLANAFLPVPGLARTFRPGLVMRR